MTYRAKPVTQRDGSTLQYSNCLMATAAVGLDFHTLGAKTSTGSRMRVLSGDTSGGTNSDEIERAWQKGYDEDPVVRDGQPWSKVISDLKEGRLVMLQWWAATVGEVCVSGAGAYGHGVAVAPESREWNGRTQWLVADPWCKPPKWGWVDEDAMRRGAEKWADKMAAGGRDFDIEVPQPGEEPSEEWLAFVSAFWAYYGDPTNAADVEPADPPGAGGANGVLFASTKPHPEEVHDDMSINTNANQPVRSARRVALKAGADFFADAGLTRKLGDLSNDRVVPLLGTANDGHPDARAVVINTSKPYDDGTARPTIVYVREGALGAITPEPPTDFAERDKQWRAWLDGDGDAPDKP